MSNTFRIKFATSSNDIFNGTSINDMILYSEYDSDIYMGKRSTSNIISFDDFSTTIHGNVKIKGLIYDYNGNVYTVGGTSNTSNTSNTGTTVGDILQLPANVITTQMLKDRCVTIPKLSSVSGNGCNVLLSLSPDIYTPQITGGLTLAPGFVETNEIYLDTINLLDGSITSNKLSTNSVVSNNIVDGSILLSKLAPNSVDTVRILDGSVTSSKVAKNAVTTTKILDNSVTNEKLANGSVTTLKLDIDSVTTTKILDYNVTNSKLSDNCVTTNKIMDGQITSSKMDSNIVLGTIKATGYSDSSVFVDWYIAANFGNVVQDDTTRTIRRSAVFNYGIQVDGEIYQYSDDRLKINEFYVDNVLEDVKKMRPQVYFKFDSLEDARSNNVNNGSYECGLIAQEIFYDIPRLRHLVAIPSTASSNIYLPVDTVKTGDPSIDPDYSSWGESPAQVNYIQVIPYLVSCVKELDDKISDNSCKYFNNSDPSYNIEGSVVGITSNSTLTTIFEDSIRFGVYSNKKIQLYGNIELSRNLIFGSNSKIPQSGDYIVPMKGSDNMIMCVPIQNVTFAEYQRSIGIIIQVLDDNMKVILGK